VPRVGAKEVNTKGVNAREVVFQRSGFSKALLCARARDKEKSLIEISSQPYAQVLVSCLGVRGKGLGIEAI
jgi:hypothetical protein